MEVRAIAAACRGSLDETLDTVHKLTTDPQSAADRLLHGMNEVLREAVDSNFSASESHASLAHLYRVLEHAHTTLIGECDSLPLLFFARSFAVVMEEAVRQLQQSRQEATVHPPYQPAAAVWSSETPRQDHLLPQVAVEEPITPLSTSAESGLSETSLSSGSYSDDSMGVAAATTAATTVAAAAAGHGSWQQQGVISVPMEPQKRQDYSAAATKGRITIYNLPGCVRLRDVQEFLRPIGAVRSLYLPTRQHDSAPLGYALAKFESNELAVAAVARLHGTRLCGAPVVVRRAGFWPAFPDEHADDEYDREHADERSGGADEPPPRFGCYKEVWSGESEEKW